MRDDGAGTMQQRDHHTDEPSPLRWCGAVVLGLEPCLIALQYSQYSGQHSLRLLADFGHLGERSEIIAADAGHRLRRAAIADPEIPPRAVHGKDPAFAIDDREMDRQGIQYPAVQFFLDSQGFRG